MPFGKYSDALGECFSLFTAKVYVVNKEYQQHTGETQEIEISDPKNYFTVLGEKYVRQISDLVENHCEKYLFPLLSESEQKRLFAGFGGDCMSGLIDCHSSKPLDIENIPDTTFEIEGRHYRMEWHYYEEEDN